MKKNVASQKVGGQLVSATDGSAFTGSVTVEVTVDAGTQATGSVGSGACTHEGNGYHTYAPAQAETNGDLLAFTFHGTGAVPATVQVYTDFPQTGDGFARAGAPAGASIAADIAAVKVDTGTTIPGRLPAALAADGSIKSSVQSWLGTAFTEDSGGLIAAAWKKFFNKATPTGTINSIPDAAAGAAGGIAIVGSAMGDSPGTTTLLTKFGGITLVKHWLGMLAGKQAADATALTEIKASGAGSGTYDPTTDSNEAIQDNIGVAGAGLSSSDDAVLSAIGALNNLSQANIRAALGMGSNNLDTQLDALPTSTELVTALGTADDATLLAIATLSAALLTDARAEPGQGAPAANAAFAAKVDYLYKAWRNKKTQTATDFKLFADDGSTVDQKSTTSDDLTTAVIGEIVSGP